MNKEIEDMLAAVVKAIGLKGDASPDQIKRAIDAMTKAQAAQAELDAAISGDEAPAPEGDKPAEEKEEGEAPPPADEPKLDALPADEKDKEEKDAEVAKLSALSATVEASDEAKKDEDVKASDAPPVVAAADESPEEKAAAGVQVIEALKTATGLDEAGCVALVQDNLDAIAKLAGKQPGSGLPTDAPPPAQEMPAQMSKEEDAKKDAKLAAADGRITALSKKIADLEAYKLSVESGAKEKAAKEAVDACIAAGKALDVEKPALMKLALADLRTFSAWTATKATVVPVGEDSKPPTPGDQVATTNLTDAQRKAYAGHIGAGIDHERARELAINPEAGRLLRLKFQK